MPGYLTPLFHHVPAFLLVLFRLSGIFLFAPLLSSSAVPRKIKVLLVLVLSFCIYPILLDPGRPSATYIGHVVNHGMSLWSLAPEAGLELLVGYAIGFAASLPLFGMQLGGHVIDTQLGIGFAGIINPDLQEQSGITAQTLYVFALTLFIILGGHRVILSILVGSFNQIPLGHFTGFQSLVQLTLGLLTVMFELGLRIAAPLLCLVFLETVAMGFLARTVPQLNILSVGFTVRILVGLGFLVVFIGLASTVYIDAVRHALDQIGALFAT